MRYLSCFLLLGALSATAQQTAPVDPDLIYRRAEARQQRLNQSVTPQDFSTLDFSAPTADETPLSQEAREACASYKNLTLQAPSRAFYRYLERAVNTQHLQARGSNTYGKAQGCIRAGEVMDIIKAAQNQLIADGWVTTRVVLQTQGAQQDILQLAVLPGKITSIREEKNGVQRTPKTFTHLRGRVLNLRELEQALDNVRRLSGLDANIDIAPAAREGESELIVHWTKTGRPYQFSFLIDDSGSNALGKYLATASIAVDNPLNFSDSFYASYTRTLKPGTRLRDREGKRHKTSTDNYYLNYTIPYRDWQLGLSASRYHYDQVIPGYARVYHYKGNNQKFAADISNTIYRDQNKKTTLDAGLWWRENRNYIGSAEIDVQKRRTAGWQLGVRQSILFPQAVFQGAIHYKKGTRMLGADPVPEEGFNEGNAKAGIWTLDSSWHVQLDKNRNWSWQNDLHLQYSDRRLISLDLLTLGGRNSVRGFSENNSLSGDSGWYWRNTLNWAYQPNHQLYLGADIGQVWGKNTAWLQDKTIMGTALGVRGAVNYHGSWQYDAFIGTPILKSRDWKKTDRFVLGFSAGYHW
jgi:shlB family hemolysin secretion/activation protein